MGLKYYSYLYSCHFPSTNIFGYSFVDFKHPNIFEYLFVNSQKSEYFGIFAQNLILIFDYLFLMKKSKSRYNLCMKNIQYKIFLEGNMSEPF